jgi:hypothetical protein
MLSAFQGLEARPVAEGLAVALILEIRRGSYLGLELDVYAGATGFEVEDFRVSPCCCGWPGPSLSFCLAVLAADLSNEGKIVFTGPTGQLVFEAPSGFSTYIKKLGNKDRKVWRAACSRLGNDCCAPCLPRFLRTLVPTPTLWPGNSADR